MEEDFEAGVHVSVAGGIANAPENARRLGCRCFQIFLGSPRSWRPPVRPASPEGKKQVEEFRRKRSGFHLGTAIGHARYLVNLAARDGSIRRRSLQTFLAEITLAEALGCEFYVLHPGHSKDGLAPAYRRLSGALKKALAATDSISILLETTAERPGTPGGSLPFLGELISLDERLGLCIDTAHLVAQGYDLKRPEELERLLDDLERHAGLEKVRLVHGNDSKYPAGSFRDRHEHVSRGALGRQGYVNMLSNGHLRRLPWILETPKAPELSDTWNLDMLRRLAREAARWTSSASQAPRTRT